MPRNVVFAIDLEPDEYKSGPTDSWRGTHITLAQLSSWRRRLEEQSQAPVDFNWFFRFDPQIERNWGRRDWVFQACPDLLRAVERHADLTGIHVHTWRWDEGRTSWFSDFADAGWRAHCFETSAEAFRSIFGLPPIASRFGDRSIWHEDIAILKQQGVRYDLTVVPGAPGHPLSIDPLASSPLPDYRRAPRVPYQPSTEDYLQPRPYRPISGPEDDFWMVPITVTSGLHWLPLRCPPFLVRCALPMNLVLRPRQVWVQLASEMDRDAAEPVVMKLRSGDLARPRYLANFNLIMERVCGHAGIRNCRFAAVDRAIGEFVKAQAAAAVGRKP
jgi:hypothetical protein